MKEGALKTNETKCLEFSREITKNVFDVFQLLKNKNLKRFSDREKTRVVYNDNLIMQFIATWDEKFSPPAIEITSSSLRFAPIATILLEQYVDQEKDDLIFNVIIKVKHVTVLSYAVSETYLKTKRDEDLITENISVSKDDTGILIDTLDLISKLMCFYKDKISKSELSQSGEIRLSKDVITNMGILNILAHSEEETSNYDRRGLKQAIVNK